MASNYYELLDSMVYNHNFIFSNDKGDFAAGWQKHKGRKSSNCYWEKNYDSYSFSIRIKNKSDQLASICQQKAFKIPIYREQIWEAGVLIKASKTCNATLIINFVPHNTSRIIKSSLDFIAEPEEDYYYEVISIPAGVDYAYLEAGIKEAGTLWIKDLMFKRVFPVNKYSTDAQGRFNINTVKTVQEVLEPINIKSPVEVKGFLSKQSRDYVEEVVAESKEKSSNVQDVLDMNTYSFCVMNQGSEDVSVKLQISPNHINWVNDDYANKHVKAGEMKIFVPNYFLRYLRLLYSTGSSRSSKLLIYFQAQG